MPKKPPSFQSRATAAAADLVSIEEKRVQRERDRKQAFDRHRPSSHKRGYTRAWLKYRLAYLMRYPLCVHCERDGKVTPAEELDHKDPHRGDMDLFWDPDNHQGLCKSCHSRKTATEDTAFARPNAGGRGV